MLAHAGVASRRQCETLILEGRVEVDGQVVDQLGARVDPDRQEIRVDGQLIRSRPVEYWLVNKPPGVVSTNRDPSGRPRVIDLVRSSERLFTVGRLDASSTGLLLLTNDGELANRLAHPRYHVEKTYQVTVAGQIEPDAIARLKKGIYLAEGKTRVERVRIRQKRTKSTLMEIVLAEGKNREIRRLLARLDHKVLTLHRTAMGPLRLGDLPMGASRRLTGKEIQALRQVAFGSARPKKAKPKKGKPRRAADADSKPSRQGRVIR